MALSVWRAGSVRGGLCTDSGVERQKRANLGLGSLDAPGSPDVPPAAPASLAWPRLPAIDVVAMQPCAASVRQIWLLARRPSV